MEKQFTHQELLLIRYWLCQTDIVKADSMIEYPRIIERVVEEIQKNHR